MRVHLGVVLVTFVTIAMARSSVAENPTHRQQLLDTNACPNCDLSGADLTGAQLAEANLTGANLSQAILTGADLTGAQLAGADLSEVDLSGATINEADLSRARLTNAVLRRAQLGMANLDGADLSGADMTGCGLYGANLSNARTRCTLMQDATMCRTTLPDGTHFEAGCRGAVSPIPMEADCRTRGGRSGNSSGPSLW